MTTLELMALAVVGFAVVGVSASSFLFRLRRKTIVAMLRDGINGEAMIVARSDMMVEVFFFFIFLLLGATGIVACSNSFPDQLHGEFFDWVRKHGPYIGRNSLMTVITMMVGLQLYRWHASQQLNRKVRRNRGGEDGLWDGGDRPAGYFDGGTSGDRDSGGFLRRTKAVMREMKPEMLMTAALLVTVEIVGFFFLVESGASPAKVALVLLLVGILARHQGWQLRQVWDRSKQ